MFGIVSNQVHIILIRHPHTWSVQCDQTRKEGEEEEKKITALSFSES